MDSSNSVEISREEFEFKSVSQIRLLVVGMGGIGAVVVREAVKAGFCSVTMMDHLNWTPEDRLSQFLIPPEMQEPENRAEASYERAQTLNHQVDVHVETQHFTEFDEMFFKNRFDAIVAAGLELDEIVALNIICRKCGVKFFATNVFGVFGYFFSDLLDQHVYYKYTRGPTAPYGGKYEKKVIRWLQCFPFSDVLNHRFSSVRSFLDMSPWYFVMRGFLKFSQLWRYSPKNNEEDLEKLRTLINEEIKLSYKDHRSKVLDSYIRMSLGPGAPVICQIVGSVLAQEVIKAVTHFDEPHNNVYLFNPITNKSEVITVEPEVFNESAHHFME